MSNSQELPGPPAPYQFIPAMALVLLPVAGLALGLVRPLAGGSTLIVVSVLLPFAFVLAAEILIDPEQFADEDEMYGWGLAVFGFLLNYVMFVCLPVLIAGIALLIGKVRTDSPDHLLHSGDAAG